MKCRRDCQAGEGLEKPPLKILGVPEEKTLSPFFCDNYYPFGLAFNSYTSGTENLYKFNGVEEQKELGLNMTMFRLYDPAIGRFTAVDPMADFMPSINPYQFGFNNPISMSDPTGLAPKWWIKFKNRIKNLFSGRANLKGTSTFVRTKPKRRKGRSGSNSSGGGSPTPPSGSGTPFIPTLDYVAIKKPSFPEHTPKFPALSPVEIDDTPVFENTEIPTGTRASFSKNIAFKSSSDQFSSYRTTEHHLAELTRLLLKYPEMKAFIVGNIGNTDHRILKGNSKEALDQPYFFLNGNKTTARNLMNARARAVYNFLLKQGVSRKQLDYGPGSIFNGSSGKRVSFELRNEGK